LAGPDTLEVIAARYYYRHTDYYRLMVKNGIILEGQNEQDSPFWAYPPAFLNSLYVGETGDRMVQQAPPGSYINTLYRRKADGKIDPSLKLGIFDGPPGYIGTQSDGRIIAYDYTTIPAGSFIRLGPGTTVSTNLVKIGNFDNRRNEGDDRFEVEVFRLGDSSQRTPLAWVVGSAGCPGQARMAPVGRSSSRVGIPALARWAAMAAPIVPEPRTAARRIVVDMRASEA
jgi:hypothetical protein